MNRVHVRFRLVLLVVATLWVAFCCPGVAAAADGLVQGTVTAVGGGSPEGIQVVPCIQSPGGWWDERWDLVATTLPGGTYDLPLAPGTYRVRFWDPKQEYGYQFWPDSNTIFDGQDIIVGDGETVTGKDQALPLAAMITGTVTADVGGGPLVGISAVASARSDGNGWPGVVGALTDESGYYELTGLPPGDFTVNFCDDAASKYASEYYDDLPTWLQDLAQVFTLASLDVRANINAGLAPASSISGTLTGSGTPMAQAGVTLAVERDGQWNNIQWTQPDASGYYVFAGLQAGTYRLQFQDTEGNFATECWENKSAQISEADDVILGVSENLTLDADLAPAGYISGTVSGAGVGFLTGMQVSANVQRDGWLETVAWAQTDTNGQYTLSGLAEGSYVVEFQGGVAWMTQYYSLTNPGTRDWQQADLVAVTSGVDTSGIDAILDPAARISGTVTGEDGAGPLEGIQAIPMQWWDDGGGGGSWEYLWGNSVQTASDGAYTIGGLEPGTYRVFFSDPSGVWAYETWNGGPVGVGAPDDGLDVVVASGAEVVGIDPVLGKGGSISGLVTGGGVPVGAGLQLVAVEPGYYHDMAWTQTASDGTYTLSGLRPGEMLVRTDGDADWLGEWYLDVTGPDEATHLTVVAQEDRPDVNIALGAASHISGIVTDGVDPIPNIRLAVYTYQDDGMGGGWWNERGDLQAWTDVVGHYDIGRLEPGSYRLGFFDDSGAWAAKFFKNAISAVAAESIYLGVGETFEADAELAAAAHITGRVTSNGTNGIENITVAAGPYDPETGQYEHIAWAQTDANGDYDLGGLPAGTFRVQFWDNAGNYLSEYYDNTFDLNEAADITLAVGGVRENVDAELGTASHISGIVTDGTDPVSGIRLAVYTYEDDGMGGGWWNERNDLQTWTDDVGHYDIGGLEPGTYRLGFFDDSGVLATEFYNNAICVQWADTITLSASETFEANAELAAAAHITGRVTSDGITGIANIMVAAGPFDMSGDQWMYEHIAWAQTDGNGDYDLGGLPAGTFRVQFWDNEGNYLSECYNDVRDWSEATDITLAAGGLRADVNAELGAASRISGIVTDGVDPIQNIRLAVYSFEDDGQGGGWWYERGEFQEWTDEFGHYDIGGLEPGTYRLGFFDDSGALATEFYNNAICTQWADTITLSASETFEANAGLAKAAHITGFVSDGVKGLPGITVAAGPFDPDTGMYEHISWTQTDMFGNYDLGGLPAGTFRVQFWDDSGNFLSEYYDNVQDWNEATDITLATGGTQADVDAQLGTACSISGTVTGNGGDVGGGDAIPAQWIDDGGGGGWWEQMWWNPGGINPDGTYTIGGLTPGTYRVGFFADPASWATEFWDDKASVTLADDIVLGSEESTTGIDADLASAGHITGRVTSDGASAGIANITVIAAVFDPSTEMWDEFQWVQTDIQGYYTLDGLPAGKIGVKFYDDSGEWLEEYYNDVRDWHEATGVTVVAGDTTPDIDATLATAAHISGTVTGEGAGALGNIDVQALAFNGEWWDWVGGAGTDVTGYYDIAGLEPGTYRIWFTDWTGEWGAEAYDDASSWMWGNDVATSIAEPAEGVDATLVAAGSIAGQVMGGGVPLTNATIVAGPYNLDTDEWDAWAWAGTDSEGRYTISGLAPGAYRVQAWDNNGEYAGTFYVDAGSDWHDGADVTVSSDTVAYANFNLNLGGHIKGTVVDPNGDPIKDVWVFNYVPRDDGRGGVWWEFAGQVAGTNELGEFDAGGFSPGEYRLSFGGTQEFGSEFWDDAPTVNQGDTITVPDYGSIVESIDATLSLSGAIEGYVKDSLGAPLANIGVNVAVGMDASGDWEDLMGRSATTDGNGYYKIADVRPEDEIFVHVWSQDGSYVEQWYDSAADFAGATGVHVPSGSTRSDVDFVLEDAGYIKGTITLERPGDGISGVGVTIYKAIDTGDGIEWQWVTGTMGDLPEDGSYEFGGLAAGDYYVQFSDARGLYASEYYDDGTTHLNATPVTVVAGKHAQADALLELAGTISGTVTHGASGVQGIGVSALLWDGDQLAWVQAGGWIGETDANGVYSIPIRPGTYRVEFRDPSGTYLSQYYSGAPTESLGDDVVVVKSVDTPDIDAVLTHPSSLTMNVTTAADEPLSGIDVELLYQFGGNWESIATSSTDAVGSWTAEGLLPGSYKVHFTDPGGVYTECYFDSAPDLASADPVALAEGTDDSITQVMTLVEVNSEPVAVADTYSVAEDSVLTSAAPGVLANDTDADNDTLTAVKVTGPSHGTLTLNSNGSFTYTPTANYNGGDSFTYKANDGEADSNTATVSITVTAVNDAPVAVANSYTTAEDTALTVAAPGVLGNDTDIDGPTLTAIKVTNPSHGAVTLNSNGSFTYTPAANYNGGDSFTYKANDGLADSNTVTVTITVTAVNDAPVAVADSYTTPQDTALVVAAPGVIGNDTDVEGTALTAAKVANPLHGTVTLNANGSFTYTPTAGYSGADSFTYRASDGAATSGITTVSLTVTPRPPTTFTRLAGADRFGTAILASKAVFATGECSAVVIATGMNYPDALSAAGLAGAANAPVLLVGGDVLRADVKAEIKRVTQGKASFKVYILGSVSAVTAKMEASIKASLTGETVERFPGANRYATAQLVAARVKSLQGASFGTKAILIPGLDYVDGLLAGPAAFSAKAPILLVGTTADATLIATLKSLGTKELVVLGTTARIPVAVETSLKGAIPTLVTKRASSLADTYGRSAAAAEYFATPANGFGLTWAGVGIATAETFPDGLGAGCVEGKLKTSLLLTKTASLPSAISTKITAHKATVGTVRFYGSAAAVSTAVETSVRNLLK